MPAPDGPPRASDRHGVRVAGSGIPVVLVHGSFGDSGGFAEVGEDLEAVRAGLRDATTLIAQNRIEAGTQVFVERVLLAPNGWADTAPDDRSRMVRHATAWLAQVRDRDALPAVDAPWAALATPVVLTCGTNSPALYAAVVHELGSRLPNCQVQQIAGVAHFPHLTAPDVYAALVRDVAAAYSGKGGLG